MDPGIVFKKELHLHTCSPRTRNHTHTLGRETGTVKSSKQAYSPQRICRFLRVKRLLSGSMQITAISCKTHRLNVKAVAFL